jgi:hypothetical protein
VKVRYNITLDEEKSGEVIALLNTDGLSIQVSDGRRVLRHRMVTPQDLADEFCPGDASHWDEDPDYPLADWQHEVADDDTRQSYKDWVESQKERNAEDCET